MRKLLKKLRSRKGESFVELLFAVLIGAAGALLVATMFTAAFNVNVDAKEKDDAYYASVTDMESMPRPESGKNNTVQVVIDGVTVEVERYGDDEYAAYRRLLDNEKITTGTESNG